MYIEFKIEAHDYVHSALMFDIVKWAEKYDIQYKTKTIKQTIRVTFDDDRHYTLFALTWNPIFRANYRVIRDLNNKV